MLYTILKNERRIKFFQKYIFLQNRTFADKKNSKYFNRKEKDASLTPLKKVKNNLESIKNALLPWDPKDDVVPWIDRVSTPSLHCEFLVIGGGVIGSSIAYWLKKRCYKDAKIIVVEKDPMYSTSSTVLSAGGLRQQFSMQENIEMSLFGAEFLRNINSYLGIEGEPRIDPYFHPYGYLMLASEKGAETLQQNSKLQNFLGANNIILNESRLKSMFPWLNTDGVALGCLGLQKEGWFDPWSLLCAFKKKALYLGVEYAYAEAIGFELRKFGDGVTHNTFLDKLIIKTLEGETRTITFANAIVAAGAASGEIAKMAQIGCGTDTEGVYLPVEPRKRYVYCFHCPDGPGLNTPLTIDYSGTYFRREGLAGNYICGRSPEETDEPPTKDLSVDYDFFDEKVWPILAHRVPAFERLKLKSCWAGYYEYNTLDQNGIIGRHPYHENLIFATGFSGHGIQQAPAVGRAVTELLLDGKFKTIDLSKLGYDRVIKNVPVREINII
ncbi:FAD-dependent oxidoreductase domain-containing protein 1 [Nomia melanderi]|uniref:FAD-dependent oxidoreductase domain-containing protein 1 n=1 Tax=Nomia melanderi TaxID=2448451 RepID=UPI0013040D2A|nr:FAD-dependent oxidoreductase domain-containing protein 1 [Nomia melanderi]